MLRDAFRQRIFLEPLGLYVIARVGCIGQVDIDPFNRQLDLHLMDQDLHGTQSALFSQFAVQVVS